MLFIGAASADFPALTWENFVGGFGDGRGGVLVVYLRRKPDI